MSLTEITLDRNPWWQDAGARAARRFPKRRDLQPRVLAHVGNLEDSRGVLLVGPRKVGKTVLLWQTIDDLLAEGWPAHNITYFDFSDDRVVSDVSPRDIVALRPPGIVADHPRAFFFDEIRRAAGWDAWLKQAVDNRAGRIVSTDSAAGLLKGESRESGTRVDELRLEGLSFNEFVSLQGRPGENNAQTLRRLPNAVEGYLALGGFPEHARSEDPSLVRERLRRDVVESAILRDLAGTGVDVDAVRRLFIYLTQSSGSVFIAKQRGEDIDADWRSVDGYLRLLEESMLVTSLHKFTVRPRIRLQSSRHPKICAADHGLVVTFALAPGADATRSRVFEAVVFRHLRDVAHTHDAELGFYRDGKGRHEADFVLAAAQRRVAIEVTKSARIRPEKLDALKKAGQIVKADSAFLIHGGLDSGVRDGVRLVPVPAFLSHPEIVLEEQP